MLLNYPMSIRDIARALELSPRDVEQDIRHLLKSLKHSAYVAVVTETRGPLLGLRVLRGREAKCHAYYSSRARPKHSD